ncbi:MAG: Rid family detoxifying hydrolase [Sediminibacterium sp.]|nr:Rid family detoxifying hydrolase [Sediminibacterium sp.]
MSKKILYCNNAPAPIGPYSQAIACNGFLFVSGQVALVPETGVVINTGIVDEAQQVMKNIGSILKEYNLTYNNIVKTTIFLSDMEHFSKVNEVYGSYFEKDFPARETVAVKGLPRGVNVEISVTAFT